MSSRILALLATSLLTFFMACSAGPSTSACGPSTCAGCCGMDGTCFQGLDLNACGAGCTACTACTLGQTCSLGVCGAPATGGRRGRRRWGR